MLVRKSLITAFIIVAFLGFLDASYLSASHYANIALPCFIVQGCDVVTTSPYSKILNIPVALLGAGFYLSVLAFTIYYIDKRKNWVILNAFPLITFLGFLASLWFLFAQVVLIKALCMYCLFSAATSTTIFILALKMRGVLRNQTTT